MAAGKGVKIAFEVSTPTDVEVAVLGADGKVVRHLAAGVLGGKNPPPEPLKAGFAQEILWDGKDDFGKPAAGGPFKGVVACCGMGIKLGRFIGGDPYFLGGSDGLVVGDDGNLYTLGAGTKTLGDEAAATLRVFNPEGKYLKTLLPFPADLPPGTMKDVARWDDAAKTWRPRNENDMVASSTAPGPISETPFTPPTSSCWQPRRRPASSWSHRVRARCTVWTCAAACREKSSPPA